MVKFSKDQLIEKLYRGRCSREELERQFEILQTDIGAPPAAMDRLMRELAEQPDQMQPAPERAQRILTRITAATKPKTGLTLSRRNGWIAGMAAAVAILVAVAIQLFVYAPLRDQVKRFASDFGQILELSLPDGSRVTLNGNSTLSYTDNWEAGGIRTVRLTGEAYFEVTKQPTTDAKFFVETSDLTVEVLGTVFNVSTRRNATEVYLEEGKVTVTLEDDRQQPEKLRLEPGEKVSFSNKNKQLRLPEMTTKAKELSWKTGVLSFENRALQDILEEVAEAHAFSFRVEDPALRQMKLTLALPTSDLDAAMQILAKTTSTSIREEDGTYVFTAGPGGKE